MTTFTNRPHLTLAGARVATEAAMAEAERLEVNVVITVVDGAGNPITVTKMDGAPLFSLSIAEKKAWTAAAAGAPTDFLAKVFSSDPQILHGLLPKVDQLLAVGGGSPITSNGAVAGAIGVSGATAEQDQAIAMMGAGTVSG